METKDGKENPKKIDAGKPKEACGKGQEDKKKDCRDNCMHCGAHCIYLKND